MTVWLEQRLWNFIFKEGKIILPTVGPLFKSCLLQKKIECKHCLYIQSTYKTFIEELNIFTECNLNVINFDSTT